MSNPHIHKLESFTQLSREDRTVLAKLSEMARHVESGRDLIREGERPDDVHLVLEGFACRYNILADGRRQITAFLVPGDFCDLHVVILDQMDHSVGTLSACKIASIPRKAILELTERYPRITRALWWVTLVDEAILRQAVVSIGRRTAEKRIAHLFFELLIRLDAVGFVEENSYQLPVTQAELADTLGLSTVHVNRVIQRLRHDGLITLAGKNLTIHDVARLKEFSGFDASYLHLGSATRDHSISKEP